MPPVDEAAPWQKQLLQQLALFGPGANPEVTIGRQPPAEPRFLAALRSLTATAASDVRGRSVDQLGDWHAPLATQLEVLCWTAACLRDDWQQVYKYPQQDLIASMRNIAGPRVEVACPHCCTHAQRLPYQQQ